MTKPIIAICASASFYPQVIAISDDIEKHGVTVILPKTAAKMKAEGRANTEAITDWSTATQGYHGKALLIREHFKEIERSDAILVMNYEKHGKQNYIGPNVLMEMSTAFYLNKPIFVLNGTPEDSPLIDEILGVEPIFLHGDLSQLSNFKT
jgi:hypothetical protein